MVEITQILIAIGGIATALGIVFQIYRYWNENRINVKVELNYGVTKYWDGEVKKTYLISVKNMGKRPITISSVSIPLPNNLKLTIMTPFLRQSLPYELRPDKQFTAEYSVDDFNRKLAELKLTDFNEFKAFFTDQLDNKYYTKSILRLDS